MSGKTGYEKRSFLGLVQIPVYRGASDALSVSYESYRSSGGGFHGRDGFNDVRFESGPDVGRFLRVGAPPAADAIREAVGKHPGGCKL